jgi:PKD repeat protein
MGLTQNTATRLIAASALASIAIAGTIAYPQAWQYGSMLHGNDNTLGHIPMRKVYTEVSVAAFQSFATGLSKRASTNQMDMSLKPEESWYWGTGDTYFLSTTEQKALATYT